MEVLLTGGSGDLGGVLARRLTARGDTAIRYDVRPPADAGGRYVPGSILDRAALADVLPGAACVVHIAAWHGIHERDGSKDVYDFWELNVRGTFEVCEAATRAGVGRLVLVSSTSVNRPETVYGHSKVLAEEVAAGYAARHGMRVAVLRPRAFVPHWNRTLYGSFAEWVRWFARGGVHVDDVAAAVTLAVDRTAGPAADVPPPLALDGAYEYTADDLARWDAAGPGTTFRRHYPGDYDLAVSHGIDPCRKPRVLDPADTAAAGAWGYRPAYSLKTALAELRAFGAAGPPPA